jgi:hypothetical protein
MKKNWVYASNIILNVTKGSYTLAMQISAYHDSELFAQLGTDPKIDAMYADYHPKHLLYKAAYDEWVAQGGLQKGQTLNLKQLLLLLSSVKADAFERAVKDVYDKDSPEFMSLFPYGRKPFQAGKQLDRISAVQALLLAIGTDVSLAALKAVIQTFYTQLDNAYIAQKGSKGKTKTKSTEVELARVEMSEYQFANIGGLIQLYFKTPDLIEPFFDLEGIRNHKQLIYIGSIDKGSMKNIFVHTFAATDMITFTSSQDGLLNLSNSATAASGTKINFIANIPIAIAISSFEVDFKVNRFLNATNFSLTADAQYKLELM